MEHYVNRLQKFADPFGVGVSVHVAIFFVNWFVVYILSRGFTQHAKSHFWKGFHNYSGWISLVLAYFLTVAFIRIKNN